MSKNNAIRCIGLCTKMVNNLAEPLKGKGCCLITNFSLVDLLQDLFSDGIGCIAMTQADRRKWPQELKSLLLDRGYHKTVVVNRVQAIIWKDNFLHVNHMTMSDSQKITTVEQNQRDGWTVAIMFPTAVYNKYMGGINLHDQDRKLYFCNRKCWHFCALATVDSPDSQLHRPVSSDQGNSCAQCTKSGKEKSTYYKCSVCNIGLCPECFEDNHRQ